MAPHTISIKARPKQVRVKMCSGATAGPQAHTISKVRRNQCIYRPYIKLVFVLIGRRFYIVFQQGFDAGDNPFVVFRLLHTVHKVVH